jgi:hypothetical protein
VVYDVPDVSGGYIGGQVIDFTDDELSAIQTIAIKSDPMQLIPPVQSVIRKISEYIQQRQQVQMQEAAKVPEAAKVDE